ncbi:hypothetical protein M5K25_010585 [Dendrobium thyrsiflorum]|uniref:Beta-glucosidase n=1 Tax=Dendrobium thyrsiflorum TaxID=117978 RepID=A0ABD0V0V0_DENTH
MAASSLRQSVSLLLYFLLLILSQKGFCTKYTREDFPSDFVFGAGTSAYQYEGAVAEDGRKPSIWDIFTHEDGRGAINPKGLEYYNNLINEIVKQGIKLHVTLYHGDHPQSLQDEYGGWLNNRIVEDFKEYANVCFREFGDRVSHWTTFAQPNIMSMGGYDYGTFAPGRCSYPFGVNCNVGNSTTEPYIVVHNILLTHAQVVKLYKNTYQTNQGGWIGMNVYSLWYYPLSDSLADIEATQRVKDFLMGILEPLVFGDYPEIMKKNVGSRLPSFTQQQSELVKGSFDFISLNHYTSSYVTDNPNNSYLVLRDFSKDMFAKTRGFLNETTSEGPPTHMLSDPLGLQNMLEYLKDKFANPAVYIEENGYGLGVIKTLHDTDRIEYLRDYIGSILNAMRNGANVRGYFVWSLVDLFELLAGYKSSYGLYYVDFDDEKRKRVPKLSAHWYNNFIKNIEGIAVGEKSLASHETILEYSRDDFPSDFVFGAGTSAFQYEGALAEDGRTPSIWDYSIYEEQNSEVTKPDIASDGYHKYKEDIELMSMTGLEGYRFSISWSRLLSSGRGAVNQKGLAYYNNVINELVKHGIQPHVSLHHLDLPQVLQDEYGGWLSPRIIDDFKGYANVCFREFGDRVFHWTTMAEPNINAIASFDNGGFPPRRCSYPFGYNCREGNSTVEPYAAAHNMLLAHAAVVKLYRTRYQPIQKGKIGINLYAVWLSPLTNSIKDSIASKRAMDFTIGWFMSPLVFGDYPEIMRKNAGSRLPTFSETESQEVMSAFDFIGINYYFASFVIDNSDPLKTGLRDINADIGPLDSLASHSVIKFSSLYTYVFNNIDYEKKALIEAGADSKDEPPIDQFIPPRYIPNNPTGLLKMLKYLKDSYGNPPIYIQENGYGLGVKDVLNDTDRISFLSCYIGSTLEAIRNGSDVRGYSVWSFLDLYELLEGYKSSFGLYHVNFEDNERQRVPKLSAYWYSSFVKHGSVIKIEKTQGEEEYHAMH